MRLVLVPLDDRPCNTLFAQRLAEIAGVDLALPPLPLLGRFLTPGEPEGLFDWLEANLSTADAAVLSLDMLLYGGLIASRLLAVSQQTALNRLARVRELHRRFPTARLSAFNCITRLGITTSDEESLRWSPLIQRYFEEAETFGGQPVVCAELEASPLLDRAKAVRRQNHTINLATLDLLAEGELEFLILGQEDCSARGVHRLEQAAIEEQAERLGVSERVALYPGADEIGLLLVARAGRARSSRPLRVSARYVPPSTASRFPPYEDRTLEDSLARQVRALGAELVAAGDTADWALLLYGGELGQPGVGAAQEAVAALLGSPTPLVGMVDVASPNGADPALIRALLEHGAVARLYAYAGWNTAGNSLGSVLAHLGSLCCSGCPAELPPRAHYRFLFERLLDDWGYQTVIRPAIQERLRREGQNPANLRGRAELDHAIQEMLWPLAQDLFKQAFSGLICREGVLTAVSCLEVGLPWPRTFEARVEATLWVN